MPSFMLFLHVTELFTTQIVIWIGLRERPDMMSARFLIFLPPPPFSAFGSDIYCNIQANCLTISAFPWPPLPPLRCGHHIWKLPNLSTSSWSSPLLPPSPACSAAAASMSLAAAGGMTAPKFESRDGEVPPKVKQFLFQGAGTCGTSSSIPSNIGDGDLLVPVPQGGWNLEERRSSPSLFEIFMRPAPLSRGVRDFHAELVWCRHYFSF